MFKWIGEWIETLRVAPPFSKRRRELLEILQEADDFDSWFEGERP